jgi:hypothetical protein
MGRHNLGSSTFNRMYRSGVLNGIELFLPLHCLKQFFVGLSQWDGADPGHKKSLAFVLGFCRISGSVTLHSEYSRANTGIVLFRALANRFIRGLPRAENRVDEHHGVEGSAQAAQTIIVGIVALSAIGDGPGIKRVRPGR